MTLTKRVIPCLDVANGRVVKGLNFESIKDAGDTVLLAEKYSNEGADELLIMDCVASLYDSQNIYSIIKFFMIDYCCKSCAFIISNNFIKKKF